MKKTQNVDQSISSLKNVLKECNFEIVGKASVLPFTNAKTLDDATESSLSWIATGDKSSENDLNSTYAQTIVCPNSLAITDNLLEEKRLIVTDNPKLVFSILVRHFISPKPSGEIHPTAFVRWVKLSMLRATKCWVCACPVTVPLPRA